MAKSALDEIMIKGAKDMTPLEEAIAWFVVEGPYDATKNREIGEKAATELRALKGIVEAETRTDPILEEEEDPDEYDGGSRPAGDKWDNFNDGEAEE